MKHNKLKVNDCSDMREKSHIIRILANGKN